MPIQSRGVFKIKEILMDTFNIDNFNSCDKLFDDYSIEKFHFHVKIKYSVNELVVKFYNTYPVNHLLIIMITRKIYINCMIGQEINLFL